MSELLYRYTLAKHIWNELFYLRPAEDTDYRTQLSANNKENTPLI